MKNKLNEFDESVQSAINDIDFAPDMSQWAKIERNSKVAKSPKKWFVGAVGMGVVAILAFLSFNDNQPNNEEVAATPVVQSVASDQNKQEDVVVENLAINNSELKVKPETPLKVEENLSNDNVSEVTPIEPTVTASLSEEGGTSSVIAVNDISDDELDLDMEENKEMSITSKKAPASSVELIMDVEVCEGATIAYELTDTEMSGFNVVGPNNYRANETKGELEFATAGYYWVRLILDDGMVEDSVQVKVNALPNLSGAVCTVDLYNTMLAKASVKPELDVAYSWSFGEINSDYPGYSQSYEYEHEGMKDIVLTARNFEGCEASQEFSILVEKSFDIKAPNAFSPGDGDGINDTWIPIELQSGDYAFTLRIYNRRGQLLYETNNSYAPWDGTVNGTVLPKGTACAWIVTMSKEGKTREFSGSLLVM